MRIHASSEVQIIDKAIRRVAEGKFELRNEQDTPVYYFVQDVGFLPLFLALGRMGLQVQIDKPQQIVKLGTDTVFNIKCKSGIRISCQVDKRGFLDVVTLS